jgi:hypothetical protein
MKIRKNLSHLFGWKTNRKIIVIESDDWGSVRTKSNKAYLEMIKAGLELDRSNFTMYDTLESNSDLECLFEVLRNHKDSTGRHPVFTPMCVVANPNFGKIKESYFLEYHFEPFTETCLKYPEHDKVHELWLQGIRERLFVPQLHGREHLNAKRWIDALRDKNEGLRIAFDFESFGASHYKGEAIPEHLAAFDPQQESDIPALHQVVLDSVQLFHKICGYEPKHFIASNSPEPKELEKTLKEIGIEFLTRYKIQRYPLGDGRFERQFNWLGKKNSFGQIYLTRNAVFEPSAPQIPNTLDDCLDDIEIAFRWGKPAVISTHRVNYVGGVDINNRDRGLEMLDNLLYKIVNKWNNVEFMTSEELGTLIKEQQND